MLKMRLFCSNFHTLWYKLTGVTISLKYMASIKWWYKCQYRCRTCYILTHVFLIINLEKKTKKIILLLSQNQFFCFWVFSEWIMSLRSSSRKWVKIPSLRLQQSESLPSKPLVVRLREKTSRDSSHWKARTTE